MSSETKHTTTSLLALFEKIKNRRLGMWAAPSAEETAALLFARTGSLEAAYADAAELVDPEIKGYWSEVAAVLQNARLEESSLYAL